MPDNRHIIHVDMDAFFASVEQLDHPELQHRPVIVGGSVQQRGVVSAASYEARRFGVHSAMPMSRAVKLCPQAVIMPGRMQRYIEVSEQIHEIFHQHSPWVEPLSVDEAFLDVTGSLQLFADAPAIGRSIKQAIKVETGLTASVGIAPNKFLAKLASDLEKPDGFVVIDAENCQSVLDPLPVGRIWGIGKKTLARLNRIGVKNIHDLRSCPVASLERILGNTTGHLLELACGIDNREVETFSQTKSISHEHTFATDIADPDILEDVLLEQVQQVAYRLRRKQFQARTVTIKIRYSDFKTQTHSLTLEEPTDTTQLFWTATKDLFVKLTGKKNAPVRLVGFGLSNLVEAGQQPEMLFTDPQEEKQKRLDTALDEINNRYGKSTIKRTYHP